MTRRRRLAPAWFGPKPDGVPGLGFTPVSWQGWAVTAGFIGLTAATFAIPVGSLEHALIVAGCVVAFGVVGRICYDPGPGAWLGTKATRPPSPRP